MISQSRYDYIADATGVVFTATQPNEILQWLSFGITLLATLISLCFSIYQWYKQAKSDEHITKDEIDALNKIVEDAKNKIDDHKKGKE